MSSWWRSPLALAGAAFGVSVAGAALLGVRQRRAALGHGIASPTEHLRVPNFLSQISAPLLTEPAGPRANSVDAMLGLPTPTEGLYQSVRKLPAPYRVQDAQNIALALSRFVRFPQSLVDVTWTRSKPFGDDATANLGDPSVAAANDRTAGYLARLARLPTPDAFEQQRQLVQCIVLTVAPLFSELQFGWWWRYSGTPAGAWPIEDRDDVIQHVAAWCVGWFVSGLYRSTMKGTFPIYVAGGDVYPSPSWQSTAPADQLVAPTPDGSGFAPLYGPRTTPDFSPEATQAALQALGAAFSAYGPEPLRADASSEIQAALAAPGEFERITKLSAAVLRLAVYEQYATSDTVIRIVSYHDPNPPKFYAYIFIVAAVVMAAALAVTGVGSILSGALSVAIAVIAEAVGGAVASASLVSTALLAIEAAVVAELVKLIKSGPLAGILQGVSAQASDDKARGALKTLENQAAGEGVSLGLRAFF